MSEAQRNDSAWDDGIMVEWVLADPWLGFGGARPLTLAMLDEARRLVGDPPVVPMPSLVQVCGPLVYDLTKEAQERLALRLGDVFIDPGPGSVQELSEGAVMWLGGGLNV